MFSSFRLCETVVPLEDPIITETTSTLQEWGVLWKQLYVVSSSSTKGVGTIQEKQTASCFVYICVLLGGRGMLMLKESFFYLLCKQEWRISGDTAQIYHDSLDVSPQHLAQTVILNSHITSPYEQRWWTQSSPYTLLSRAISRRAIHVID